MDTKTKNAIQELMDKSLYEEAGKAFLDACNVFMEVVEAVPQTAPRWAKDEKHGVKYSVLFAKIKNGNIVNKYTSYENQKSIFSENIYFDFWGSIRDKEEARNMYRKPKKPSAYNILASIDNWYGDTFEDWCFNYGYDEDSRKAFETYRDCKELGKKLAKVFTPEEMEVLSMIN